MIKRFQPPGHRQEEHSIQTNGKYENEEVGMLLKWLQNRKKANGHLRGIEHSS